jgi:hypothetical protein
MFCWFMSFHERQSNLFYRGTNNYPMGKDRSSNVEKRAIFFSNCMFASISGCRLLCEKEVTARDFVLFDRSFDSRYISRGVWAHSADEVRFGWKLLSTAAVLCPNELREQTKLADVSLTHFDRLMDPTDRPLHWPRRMQGMMGLGAVLAAVVCCSSCWERR